jgi:hypothetical protein
MKRRNEMTRALVLALLGAAGCAPPGATVVDCGATPSVPEDLAGEPPEGPPCDVRQFGAAGDGRAKDTRAIQSAIDQCAGTDRAVLLSNGIYLSGMIQLRSNTTLRIAPDATLLGTQDDGDYPITNPPTTNTLLHYCRKALVYAEAAQDIHIEGGGVIDGNGLADQWSGSGPPEASRPMAVYAALCDRVTVRDVTIRDAAMWALVNLESDDVTIRNVRIESTVGVNRDGMDIVDCHRVLVEGVALATDDDSICLKSGSARGVEDVTVRHARVCASLRANAMKLGTTSAGGFRHILFEDVVVDRADKAAMAVESVDGAAIEDVVFDGIRFRDVGAPIFVLLGRRSGANAIGTIDGVTFRDVAGSARAGGWGSPISGTATDGTTYRLTNLLFDRVAITAGGGAGSVPDDPPEYAGQYPESDLWGALPAFGYYLRHADGVTFSGCTTGAASPDARKWLETRDVTNLVIR